MYERRDAQSEHSYVYLRTASRRQVMIRRGGKKKGKETFEMAKRRYFK